jgi:hypothetical protein
MKIFTPIGGASPMASEAHISVNGCQSSDVTLDDEIKCRAYELYEQCYSVNGNESLRGELPRVVYAAAELAKYEKGDAGDTRSTRAARVYLRALCNFIGERDSN